MLAVLTGVFLKLAIHSLIIIIIIIVAVKRITQNIYVNVLRETLKDMVVMIVSFKSELQKLPGQAYFNYEKYYSANIYLRSHQKCQSDDNIKAR